MPQEALLGLGCASFLPDEILLKIFKKVASVHELRCVIPQVCKKWRQISNDPLLWRNRVVKFYNLEKLKDCPKDGDKLLKFICATPQLQKAHLMGCYHSDHLTMVLNHLNRYCKNLDTLIIDGPVCVSLHVCSDFAGHIPPEGFNKHWKFSLNHVSYCLTLANCQRFTKLRNLEIKEPQISSRSSYLTRELAIVEENHFRRCSLVLLELFPGLRSLKLGWAPSDMNLILGLKETLEILEMNILFANPKSLRRLCEFKKLKRLDIRDSCPNLAKLLSIPIGPLMSLHLEETFFSPVFSTSDLEEFFSSSIFTRLESIKMQNCRIDDKGALAIRKNCPALQSLEIGMAVGFTLSKTGLSHFLHLDRLIFLEIRFHNREDWNFRRLSELDHTCIPDEPCPLDVDFLLTHWEEMEVEVTLCED